MWRARKDRAARRADRIASERRLEIVKARTPHIEELALKLQEYRERNHFGEAIEMSFARRGQM